MLKFGLRSMYINFCSVKSVCLTIKVGTSSLVVET